ncbi:thioredoxin [Maribacter sp. 4U21]|uniref:thioredoxin family protein n=1 Tax=Maribacter sp. 4U21 TaxID=1889779 RepID=UPI000C361628|nr:thioredoxin family protein [Maribacter sp. 4U21]PIB30838.1 thioredoxin [Maribacter sp. 4U21]
MGINTMIRKEDTLVTALGNSYSYEEYRNLVEKLAAEGKSTGPVQTEALANYTQLNDRRMKRWDKTLRFSEEAVSKITAVSKKMTWTVLTESWCGDASPALPVMNKIAELNPNIQLRVVLRDENTDLMNRFLTNGGMSIPKLIVRDDVSNEVVADWGPRSVNATKLVEDHKAVHGMIKPEFKQDIQVWYNKDKGQSILADLLLLLPLE